MKYAILETDHQMESKGIPEFVDTIDEFLSYVVSILPDAKIVESVDVSDLKNSCFKNADYLLFSPDKRTIKLVKKSTTQDAGYIYNSDKSTIELIRTFELAEIEDKQKQTQITVDDFYLNEMRSNPSIMIIGKRGTGKTYIISNILDAKTDDFISDTLIISQKDANFYMNRYPNALVVQDYDSNFVKAHIQNEGGAIVFDDCLYDYVKNTELIELMRNNHHYNKTVISSVQFPLSIKPELRSSFDYVFLLNDDVLTNQKKMFDHYAGYFPDFDSFRQVYGNLTQKYGSMVIKNCHTCDKIGRFKATAR